ncbi:MAG: UvrD-helicase domain-containing protein [Microscillaceae bacterium]|nr:UvrD-helicase domain-containing protein [Microscillaceae bacterium]MDW8460532.1 UvrD-helicase domain-containing protein [Cytophagales bacterium]
MSHNFKVYSSSAGSGKTYTLTKEYIKLALYTPQADYFKHILAITFTNDAANEMKERILKILRTFAQPESIENEMLQNIAQELTLPPQVIQQRAEKVFQKLIHNYADFAVSTIDKFMNKVANAFTQELDIPYNYEIDLDTEQLVQNATDRILERVGREQEESISSLLIEWAKEKNTKGQSWQRIEKDLQKFAKDLMNEKSYDFVKEVKELSLQELAEISYYLKQELNNYAQEIQTLAQQAIQLIKQYGLTEKDFYQASKGVYDFLQEIAQGNFTKKSNTYVNQTLRENKWTSSTKNKAVETIQVELSRYLSQIITISEKITWLTAITPHLYQLALVQEIEHELQLIKQENNTIHISDTNRKIAQIVTSEPVPFIYERIGEKYHHILVDEFQDTSILQWENILPLIENNLGNGYFNLIVGDAKQAIYRWRGSELEQLVYLYRNEMDKLVQKSKLPTQFIKPRYKTLQLNHTKTDLSINYRSAEQIIDFNNDFFDFLRRQEFDIPLFTQVYDERCKQYLPTNQNHKNNGYVEFNFLPCEDKQFYIEKTHQKILETIAQVQTEGFTLKDIAILTRRNTEAREIANFLKQHQIEVISQEALLLVQEPKIRFIVAILKMLDAPEEKLLKTEVLYLFYTIVKKQVIDSQLNRLIKEIINQPIYALYDLWQAEGYATSPYQLLQLSLYELAEKIVELFHLTQDQQGLAYLFRFLDVILQFSLQKNTTLTDFIQYWEEKQHTLAINSPKDKQAITITTIHKSKGLEYPVVILPFADWEVTPKSDMLFWLHIPENHQPSCPKKPEKKLTCVALPFSKAQELPLFANQCKEEEEKTFIENINLVYVAFTRPIYQLYVFTEKNIKENQAARKKLSYWLKKYLNYLNIWQENKEKFTIQQANILKNSVISQQSTEYFIIRDFISTDIHKKINKHALKKKV